MTRNVLENNLKPWKVTVNYPDLRNVSSKHHFQIYFFFLIFFFRLSFLISKYITVWTKD